MIKKIFQTIAGHKIIVALTIIALAGGGYYGYGKLKSNTDETRYVLANVEKGTLITSVSGSGQISVSNQIDVKPKVSGDLTSVAIKNGQEVKTGAILAQIDAKDAYKTVRDAQVSLESAKLSLEKTKKSADALSLLQAENALTQANESKQSAEKNLEKSYTDGFNTISNALLDLPSVMSGLYGVFFNKTFENNIQNLDWYANQAYILSNADPKVWQYRDDAKNTYDTARQKYDQLFEKYKGVTRDSDEEIIEEIISESYDTVRVIADAIKAGKNFIDLYQDLLEQRGRSVSTAVSTHQSNLNSYTMTTNSHLASLFSASNSIQTNKTVIVSAERTVAEKTASLADLKAGADPLDIQSQELAVKQKEIALSDAREELTDYTVRAPFDGVIANTDVKKGDSVSASTAIATLITKQRVAEISLNEVDVAKIKVGQKVTLTFDAVEDLSITGEVAEIDTLGTVTQGVVTYNTKIIFDTQDERVKPGMSVSASIITDIKQDILMVSNSAIKTSGNAQYVEMPDEEVMTDSTTNANSGVSLKNPLRQQTVQTGLANDSYTEITSGLKQGDKVIVRTITSSSSTTTTNTQSQQARTQSTTGLRIPGIGNPP